MTTICRLRNHATGTLLLACILLFNPAVSQAQTREAFFQQLVDSMYHAHPEVAGFLVHVEAPDQKISWTYAIGARDRKTHLPLLTGHPVLIASNTKTYVAAAVLRLVEEGKLRIDQPVQSLLSKKSATALTAAGYQLQQITLRQLMSHSSGIRDYVDDEYFSFVNENRNHRWTRDEQIALAAGKGGPYAAPADSFRYADINYLLLTEVIESVTGKPFYKAMRSLLRYDALTLRATRFTQLEPPPSRMLPLAHQYWNKYPWDTYDIDPSWDLYGGGGMVATVKDMALFFQGLFGGRVIRNKAVLDQMVQDIPANKKVNYCLGIRKVPMAGLTGYYHGGFWGTDAIYLPALNASVAIVTLERSERERAAVICKGIVEQLKLP